VAAIAAPGTHEVGVLVVAQPWDPAVDATDQCIERSPPWDRRDDLFINWRFLLLLGAGGLAAILGFVGLTRTGALPAAGAATGVLAALLFVLIWITKSV
jgi:hypothetical protein